MMKNIRLGKVESYLKNRITKEGTIHLTLLDPEKTGIEAVGIISAEAEKAGTSAILIGGSTIASSNQVDSACQKVKSTVKVPVILFPGNVSGVSRFADAIFFMSLLTSGNPYYLIDAQAIAAPAVKKYGVEAIPVGYLIMGSGGSAGFIGYARPITYDKPEIAVMYTLAAQYLGMRMVYLEAGSGVKQPIPPEIIKKVKSEVEIPLIVGGGIRSRSDAEKASRAGASMIVTGTIVEETSLVREKIGEIIKGIIK